MAVYVYASTANPRFENIAKNLDLPIDSITTDAEVDGKVQPLYTYVNTSRDLDAEEKDELDQAMLDRGLTFVK